jgi:prepilin-type processing-associated H-X9-DG protein
MTTDTICGIWWTGDTYQWAWSDEPLATYTFNTAYGTGRFNRAKRHRGKTGGNLVFVDGHVISYSDLAALSAAKQILTDMEE